MGWRRLDRKRPSEWCIQIWLSLPRVIIGVARKSMKRNYEDTFVISSIVLWQSVIFNWALSYWLFWMIVRRTYSTEQTLRYNPYNQTYFYGAQHSLFTLKVNAARVIPVIYCHARNGLVGNMRITNAIYKLIGHQKIRWWNRGNIMTKSSSYNTSCRRQSSILSLMAVAYKRLLCICYIKTLRIVRGKGGANRRRSYIPLRPGYRRNNVSWLLMRLSVVPQYS